MKLEKLRSPFWHIVNCVAPYKYLALLTFLLVLASQSVNVFYSYVYKLIIDTIELQGLAGKDQVFVYLAILVGMFTFNIILWRGGGFAGSYWITGAVKNSYQNMFYHTIHHRQQFFESTLSGKLVSKISNSSEAVESILNTVLWNIFSNIIKFLVIGFFIFQVHFYLGIAFVIGFLIILLINIKFGQMTMEYAIKYSESGSELRGQLTDVFVNIFPVQTNAQQKKEAQNTETYNQDYKLKNLKYWHTHEWFLAASQILSNTFFISLILLSFWLWSRAQITLGDVTMMILFTQAMWDALLFLGTNLNTFFQRWGECSEGLAEVYHPHHIKNTSKPEKSRIKNGAINFNQVTFDYGPYKKFFNHLNLEIKAGEKIGIVGLSGSGKTSLTKLLLRFYDLDAGSITIDGQDISQIRLEDLRKNISYVAQEPTLFHRSLRENIMYSHPKATKKELEQVLDLAHVNEFLKDSPDGLETMVGERGVKLSGGQKQRVAIARAMLKKSPILIMDEATSALDSESEKLIQDALENLMQNRTTLVIAHRLSTIKKMDRIIVMDNGQIIENGSHKDLLKKGGTYKKLWEHQFQD